MARSTPVGGILQISLAAALAVAAQGCGDPAAGEGARRDARPLTAAGCSADGAHALHGRDTPIHAAFKCTECHRCPGPGSGPNWGALAASQGATPCFDPAALTCSGVYCHGAKLASPPATPPVWTPVSLDDSAPPEKLCSTCHGYPPPAPHPQRVSRCSGCHAATVRLDGTIDLVGGHHIDGQVDVAGGAGAGCAGCHEFPPATGAHGAHVGIADAATGDYGDTSILQDRYPDADPASAPAVYAFGCGNCHPLDPAKHMDGTLEVELIDPAAPAGSLKARASPGAAYDEATGTCSGTYCHSSGQDQPTSVVTPSWRAPTSLGCDGCHGNPPRYASGGAGTSTANSHLALAPSGREWGHFLGEAGPDHGAYHGGIVPGRDAAPITCQTCHFDTTDPANTGVSGFYWLDTTGAYQLPGGDLARLTSSRYLALDCTVCHASGGPAEPGSGKVLPLRHVNGTRDVVFDRRTSLPDLGWLPSAPNRPALPYWESSASASEWRGGVTWSGTTVSFALAGAAYEPATKTCSNVACHVFRPAVWGAPYSCTQCHRIHQTP